MSGVTWYFSASCQKSSLSSAASPDARRRGRSPARILVDVVELPLVLVGVPAAAGPESGSGPVHLPGDAVEPRGCEPAVLVHGTVAEDLEILLGVQRLRLGSSNVPAKLTPWIGICSTPFTSLGAAMPAASRIVGATSITCVNCERSPPPSLIRFGQETTIGSRVPPKCEATCLPHWNGVFPGPGPGAGEMRRLLGPPQPRSPPRKRSA